MLSLLAYGSDLFAGTAGGGLFHSSDSGKSWGSFRYPLTDSTITALATDSAYLFAGTGNPDGRVLRIPLEELGVKEAKKSGAGASALKILSFTRAASIVSISVNLPGAGRVQLSAYDLSGHLVSTIADRAFRAGRHMLQWDTRAIAPGCYLVRLEADGRVEARVVPVVR